MRIAVFNQRVDLVHVTTHNVAHNLVVGMGLVVLVLFVFLGDVASASIVAAVIPLSLLFAVTALFLQGRSANLLSIGAVDFGIIVDSSVIIVENIYRPLTEHGADRSRPLKDRILEAASEIERPLFFSTAIIVCAFLPLFFMSGPAGALFGPMANTYALAIGGALLLAVSLAPVLCSFFFGGKTEEKDTLVDAFLKGVYGTVLRMAPGGAKARGGGEGHPRRCGCDARGAGQVALMNERPGDRHALLLTAGKLARQIRQPAPEPEPVEEGGRGREGPCP
jgi:cobalt-zinc-cadmium resistance protein CzcA